MKSKNFKRITCILVFVQISLNAQVNLDYNNTSANKYTIAPPDVYNFEKYNLNEINYYVGKPIITVPIYTIKTGKMEYPINLVYDAGGVKVDQYASNVGLGWNLTSTILTRTINQDNDFDNTGSLRLQLDVNTYPQSDISMSFELRNKEKVGYFLQKQINEHFSDDCKRIDFIPDVYNFYTNGFSTSFYFNDENTPIEINPKGTKIFAIKSKRLIDTQRKCFSHLAYNLTTQDFFTIIITTKEGIKYTFSDCDLSYNEDFIVDEYVYGDNESLHPPAQVSAWHITKIEDLNTAKKIDFTYSDYSSNPNSNTSPLLDFNQFYGQRNFEFVSNPYYTSIPPVSCNYPVYGTFQQGAYSLNKSARVDVVIKYLKKIVFDEGEVVINYGGYDPFNNQTAGPREDVYGTEYISDIFLQNNNHDKIKSFKFNYSYFVSNYNMGEFNPDNSFNAYRYKRLKLNTVFEVGKPAYKFYYNESINLPPINSFSVDFLGYYNHSPDANAISFFNTNRPRPTLYYYPNNYEKSLLPFPITSMTGLTIPGYFDRQTNINVDFTKAWSLNKIEYPTGGSSEYTYELNEFEEFGQNIKGGGLRIAQQKLSDGIGGIRTLNYSYLKENSSITSGKLSSLPYFGHPTEKFFPVDIDFQLPIPIIITPPPGIITNTIGWKIFGKSNLNTDITSGAYVGYSRVVESEVNNGKKEFLFTSNNSVDFQNTLKRMHPQEAYYYSGIEGSQINFCLSDFMIANSSFGANIFTDNSYKRGKLILEKIYNDSNQLLKQKTINYSDNVFNTYSFYQPFIRIASLTGDQDNFIHLLTTKKNIKIAQFLPLNETTVTYDVLGNHIDETSSFTYNSIGMLKTLETSLSNGDVNKTEYFYPTEVTTSLNSLPGIAMSLNDNSMYRYMITNRYKVGERIQTNYYKNNILNSYTRRTFNIYNPLTNFDNVVSSKAIQFAKESAPLQNLINIDKYDINFNATQYTSENGSPVSLIWGYNQTKLIAKIENCLFANLSATTIDALQTLSNADYDNCRTASCKEQILRNALNSLRTTLKTSYPDAMVTTYTYDPLVGVTSVTDPKEDIQYYTYDSLERLIKVEDKSGNILSENQYNYKP